MPFARELCKFSLSLRIELEAVCGMIFRIEELVFARSLRNISSSLRLELKCVYCVILLWKELVHCVSGWFYCTLLAILALSLLVEYPWMRFTRATALLQSF